MDTPGAEAAGGRRARGHARQHGGMPDRNVPVRWEVAADEGFRKVVRRGTEFARPELAHSVHVEVEGLAPAR